jgi:Ni,Fe-hydrogenase III small subunit
MVGMRRRWLPAPRTRPDPVPPADAEAAGVLAARLDGAAQARLGRSLALLAVSAGGCGACELELRMLDGVAYGLARLGLRFVGVPGQADVLLATGPLTRNMHGALLRTWEAMPGPRWLVAVGGCAIDGGVFAGSYATLGGIGAALPPDLVVPGCPPTPAAVLAGLHTLIAANT